MINKIKKKLYKLSQFLLSNKLYFKFKINFIDNKNLITILNFHRINNNKKIYNSISPNNFNQLILFIKQNFELVNFNDLIHKKKSNNRPLLIISFDDAYEDFFYYAAEIIDRHKIKVNQNIIPKCVLTKDPPINVQFQDLFLSGALTSKDKYNLENLLKLSSLNLSKITTSIKNLPLKKQKQIYDIYSNKIHSLDRHERTRMMDLSQIKSLNRICEYGLHSYEHATMTYESLDYFKKDIAKSLSFFNNSNLAIPNIYAFPNGQYENEHINFLNNNNFKFILLVDRAFNKFKNTGVFKRLPVLGNTFSKNLYTSLGGVKFK